MATFPTCVLSLCSAVSFVLSTSIPIISLRDVMDSINPSFDSNPMNICKKLEIDPYFDLDRVLGDWIIVHSWNVSLQNKCVEVKIRYATEQITKRFMNDMYDHLESQPLWDAATLYLTMGVAEHEMLLFADQGTAGSFVAIPNILKEASILPMRTYAVPLLKFHVKLLHGAQYLLIADCKYGVSSLMARKEDGVDRLHVLRMIKNLDIGEGMVTCDVNIDELKRQGYIL